MNVEKKLKSIFSGVSHKTINRISKSYNKLPPKIKDRFELYLTLGGLDGMVGIASIVSQNPLLFNLSTAAILTGIVGREIIPYMEAETVRSKKKLKKVV
jgi:hypothetical protein